MSIKKELIKCKGCMSTYEGRNAIERCMIFQWGNRKECPCRECLIKVICNHNCDSLLELVEITMESSKYINGKMTKI